MDIGEMAADIAALREDFTHLVAGLTQMMETQAVQTELLHALLKAATADDDSEGSLGEALGRIADALAEQSHLLQTITTVLTTARSETSTNVRSASRP